MPSRPILFLRYHSPMPQTALWIALALGALWILWAGLVVALATMARSAIFIPAAKDIRDADESELPEDFLPFVDANAAALEAMGMTRLGAACIPAGTQQLQLVGFAHPNRRDQAAAARHTYPHGDETRSLDYIEFCTFLADGRSITTTSSHFRGSIISTEIRSAFPHHRDPATLHRIHEAAVAQAGSPPRTLDPSPARWLDPSRRFIQDWAESAQRRGHLRQDPATGRYRFTVLGALAAAIDNLPPVSLFRAAAARSRANTLLREAGVGPASPPPPP